MNLNLEINSGMLKKLIDRWDANGGQVTLEITVNINTVAEKPEGASPREEVVKTKPTFKDFVGKGFR